MTVSDLIQKSGFSVINAGDTNKVISKPFCCDLLSIAMSKAPSGCAWVTVMGNVNTLAVCVLTDSACVILAENVSLDDAAAEKAKIQNVTVLKTELPVFDAALLVNGLLNA